jgi:hypothetical protein
MSDPEYLLAHDVMRLFGCPFAGLTLGETSAPWMADPLGTRLLRTSPPTSPEPQLARVYGYSFKGAYYKLSEPVVMLVWVREARKGRVSPISCHDNGPGTHRRGICGRSAGVALQPPRDWLAGHTGHRAYGGASQVGALTAAGASIQN